MSQMRSVHGPDQRHVVRVFCRVRQKLGNFQTALSMLREFERRRHKAARFANGSDFRRQVTAWTLSGEFLQRRLVIEKVHLAGTAVHAWLNDSLRFWRMVGGLGLQIVGKR